MRYYLYIVFISIIVLLSPKHVSAAYRIGIDYHATGANFSDSAFISQYHIPAVRETVISQLRALASQGIEVVSTRLWLSDPPDGRFPELHERLGFPPSPQELTNLRQYVQDIATIKTPNGNHVDFYLTPLGNACASLTGQYCHYTWDQTVSLFKQSYDSIFTAVGDIARSDGKKAVSRMYITGELMVGAHTNLDKFMIQLYPYFVSLAHRYGITPSVYFIITPEESNILNNSYVDANFPILNNHKSLYWLHRDITFLRQNNLFIPSRIDFSLYPGVVSSTYEAVVKRVFDDLAAVYPNTQFGISETFYPMTQEKRRALGSALFAESNRRNLLQEVLFWTTPNSGEHGENAGFPFDVASYMPALATPTPTVYTMYYCRTDTHVCTQTATQYTNKTSCQANLTIYVPGNTSGICYTNAADCQAACSSQSSVLKPGDLTTDGNVDIFDYNIIISQFNTRGAAGFTPADINRDGNVDIFDYNIVITNFGK